MRKRQTGRHINNRQSSSSNSRGRRSSVDIEKLSTQCDKEDDTGLMIDESVEKEKERRRKRSKRSNRGRKV